MSPLWALVDGTLREVSHVDDPILGPSSSTLGAKGSPDSSMIKMEPRPEDSSGP